MTTLLSKQSDDDVATEIMGLAKKARTHSKDWRKDAKDFFGLVAGDQWEEADREKLSDELRPVITYSS